jgi:hypothetical protein
MHDLQVLSSYIHEQGCVLHFLLHAGATSVDGMDNMDFLDIPTPKYGDMMDILPPYEGDGLCGRLPDKNCTEEVEGSYPCRSTKFYIPSARANAVKTFKYPVDLSFCGEHMVDRGCYRLQY